MKPVVKNILKALVLVAVLAVIGFCNRSGTGDIIGTKPVVKIDGPVFGTFYGITVVGDYPGGELELRQDAEAVLQRINHEISTFDKTSEISRFNDSKSTEPFPVSDDTAVMVIESFRAGRELYGVLDITVGPLVDLWGFGHVKKESGYIPSRDEIDRTRTVVGLDKLHLDYGFRGSFLRKDHPDMRVDLATVGEGFAADSLAKMLDDAGIRNYMVHVAGAMRTRGFNAKGAPWSIAIEQPADIIGAVGDIVDTRNRAISTAGTYRNYFEKDGKRYSHAIDPRTGSPIEHNTVSVTVIGDSATFTDAMDTGLLVLGADEALKYANEHNLAIYCIVKEPGGFRARWSRAFRDYLIRKQGK